MGLRKTGGWRAVNLGLWALALACNTASPPPASPAALLAATATASPEPSPTASATPTATSTPLPTMTVSPTRAVPTPTAVPPAVPTPAPPAALRLTVEPAQVPPGGAFVLRVAAPGPLAAVRATLDGRSLPVQAEGVGAWAVAGSRSDAPLGGRTLMVTVRTTGGTTLEGAAVVAVAAGGFSVERITIEPGGGGGDLLDPTVLNTEWNRLLGITRTASPQRRWEGPFILPVAGPVTSVYGTRRSYNGGPAGSPHEGTDFGVDPGTPVVAANARVVVVAEAWKVRGNAVILDHGLGLFSGYYHLDAIAVQPGQAVAKGELLGRSGATGLATGPHLHWEVVLQGQHTQPHQWTQRVFP